MGYYCSLLNVKRRKRSNPFLELQSKLTFGKEELLLLKKTLNSTFANTATIKTNEIDALNATIKQTKVK